MKFDITVEPWLPVKALSGDTKDVSLLEVLEEAHQLKAIDGLNPMEEYSVLRFLSVFLTAVFRPETWEDKLELLDEGRFDMEKVRGYIEMCHAEGVSFDIFDEKRPFMQATPDSKYDQDKNLKSPAILDSTRASGNNHTHYDHTPEDFVVMSPAEAFRGLLAAQIFCVPKSYGSTSHYYTNVYGAPPTFYLPKGETLFESLILAMVTILSGKTNGIELWRNRSEIIPDEEVTSVTGIYGMFFPARRIRLLEDNGNVKRVYYQPGLHFTGFAGWTDPHVAYRLNKVNAMVSIKPSLGREGWRNLGTLAAQFADNDQGVPTVLKEYGKLLDERGQTRMEIMTFGAVTDNASFYDLQQGTFTLDTRIAKSVRKSSAIGEAASVMEEVGSILQNQLKKMIAPEKPKNKREKQRGENDVQNLVHAYYTKCEPVFYALSDEAATLEEDKLPETVEKWKGDVVRLSREIFDEAQEIYCSTSAELFRAEKARKWFNIEIGKRMKGR